MLEKTIQTILDKHEISYMDILVKEGYQTKFHFLSPNANGMEKMQVYSMSKGLTVAAVMGLVEQGKLSLEDRVADYFPCFEQTFYEEKGEKRPNREPIRIWNLFTMTSGLSYDVESKEILEVTERLGQKAKLQDYVPALAKTPMSFPVGEKFQYSLSHDLLAAVVEKVTDMPFDAYVKKAIFDPLGMDHSTFQNETEGLFPLLSCDADGVITDAPRKNVLLFSDSYISGGAGLNTTVEDYSTFASVLANGGTAKDGYQLLSKHTVEQITKPLLQWDFLKEELIWLPPEYGYGLGVRVRTTDTPWGLHKGEFGWDGAAGSFWLCDPARKVSIVMGMNILWWENRYCGIHFEILKQLYQELF